AVVLQILPKRAAAVRKRAATVRLGAAVPRLFAAALRLFAPTLRLGAAVSGCDRLTARRLATVSRQAGAASQLVRSPLRLPSTTPRLMGTARALPLQRGREGQHTVAGDLVGGEVRVDPNEVRS